MQSFETTSLPSPLFFSFSLFLLPFLLLGYSLVTNSHSLTHSLTHSSPVMRSSFVISAFFAFGCLALDRTSEVGEASITGEVSDFHFHSVG